VLQSSASTRQTPTLASLPKGHSGLITGLRQSSVPAMAQHLHRLRELGFLPGERVRVIAKGFPSGDPIAVRIGHATFALRRFEADLIDIAPDAAP
jgi:ferrous iron transport protein A